MRQQYRGQLEDLLEKVEVYEQLLHDIQLYAEVVMDHETMKKLIGIVCSWSYAHRAGNGELSDAEVSKQVKYQFDKLANRDYVKSK